MMVATITRATSTTAAIISHFIRLRLSPLFSCVPTTLRPRTNTKRNRIGLKYESPGCLPGYVRSLRDVLTGRGFVLSCLEVVPDPHRESRLAPLVAAPVAVQAAAVVPREQQVLPRGVEKRPPGTVQVDREAERERLEAQPVRRATVLQAEAVDDAPRAERQDWLPVRVEDRDAERVDLVAGDRLAQHRVARPELVALRGARVRRRLVVEPRAADAGEEVS